MSVNIAFAKNLKTLREERGITQNQLAGALNLRSQTVNNWERKNLYPRSPEVIKLLCDYFGVTEVDLFGFTDGYYAKHFGLDGAVKAASSKTSQLPVSDDEKVSIPDFIVQKYPTGFVMRMSNDSMQHDIPEGAVLYVSKEGYSEPGAIYAVNLEGVTLVRRLKQYDDVYFLEPSTCAQYKREFVDVTDTERFTVLGRVVWIQMEL